VAFANGKSSDMKRKDKSAHHRWLLPMAKALIIL
jgi:hypothetical protein